MNTSMMLMLELKLFNQVFYIVFIMIITVASFNVNGLRQNMKRKAVFYFLKQKQFDIILLQETHSLLADEKLWQCEWGGEIVFSH